MVLVFIKRIGKPFKKGHPDAEIISRVARDTQYQVSNMMTNRAALDIFEKTYPYSKLLATVDRDSFISGRIYSNPENKKSNEKTRFRI